MKVARNNSKYVKVFVRETDGARRSSAPVSLTVELTDENDNAPVIEGGNADISLPAGNTRRKVALLRASDIDSSSQGEGGLRYRLMRVSNNGMRKFLVNPTSGQVEVVGKVKDGERYSLTVAAADSGGKSSQTVIEVRVTSGPNLRGPMFGQFLYEASVSEGAPKFSSVVATSARDPEGGPVTYSISGGNDEGHFQIEESTGVVRVMDPLDREKSDEYKLVSVHKRRRVPFSFLLAGFKNRLHDLQTVHAMDVGGKQGTATVNVVVTDVNDESPLFDGGPYSFRVREGESGADVGKVRALDSDSGDNANVHYSVPEDSPFSIDAIDGRIR